MLIALAIGGFAASAGATAKRAVFLGVTTSTENSGLLAVLVDAFEASHQTELRAVTAGSGAVLSLAAHGDVDLVLVHSPVDEERFVAEGLGVERRPVMHNRFVIVGPEDDPADVAAKESAAGAFAAIAARHALFVSRGDQSGTHRAEQRLWRAAGIDIEGGDVGDWYRRSGAGQGATLNIAANLGAYALTDEATWETFNNRSGLAMLFSSDRPEMINRYSVILVNPARFPGINADGARRFADWLTSADGRAVISSFRANGRQLFHPADQASE